MSRVATDQRTILAAILSRIRGVDGFSEQNCVLTVEQNSDGGVHPATNLNHDVFCTVKVLASFGDEGAFEGGGENVVVERAGIMVTIFSRMKLDRNDTVERMLLDPSRGLLEMKRRVLKALCGYDIPVKTNEASTGLVEPITCSSPTHDGERGSISLTFSTDFEWDLTS